MRAAVIQQPGRHPTVVDRERPRAGRGEALVEVTAAPVTPLDLLCASGTSYLGVPSTPYVPGTQGVGSVDGGLVWFPAMAGIEPGDGSMAAFAVVPEADLVPLPAGTDAFPIAALGLSAIAAHMALIWRGELAPGDQVLVLGAGGAVGHAAVQIARAAGARRIVAGARSAAGRTRAHDAGADAVVALDTDDVSELATRFEAACDGPTDLVLDPLFGPPAAAAARSLRRGGRLVNLGSSAAETCPLDSSTLRGRSLRVLGYTNLELTREQRADALDAIVEQVSRGELRVEHDVVPLERAAEAWARQAAGTAGRRIVLSPARPPHAAAQ